MKVVNLALALLGTDASKDAWKDLLQLIVLDYKGGTPVPGGRRKRAPHLGAGTAPDKVTLRM